MKKIWVLICLIYVFFSPIAQARPHLPSGGYLQSCNQCTMTRNVLNCMCESRRGHVKDTSLRIRPNCGDIENINGNLHCSASGESGEINRDNQDNRSRGSFDVNAGQIYNQADAERKCPRACRHQDARWTGDWRTHRRGKESVCGCQKSRRDRNKSGLPFNIKL